MCFPYIRKILTIKEPHVALFVAPTGVGRTQLALDLLEPEYFNHFDYVIIICTTLRYNIMYRSRKWFWTISEVIPIVLGNSQGNHLYDWIKKLGTHLAGYKTLFLIDDIIADETLDKRRQPLLELAISRRHKGHLLWLLMQSYTAIPMNIRRQMKMFYIWYPKK